MHRFRIERTNNVAITFFGDLLADVSSHEATGRRSQRWSEVRIYRTQSNQFVAERVGQSVVAGERALRTVTVGGPNDIVRALQQQRPSGEWYMTDLDHEALEQASMVDPNLLLEERL